MGQLESGDSKSVRCVSVHWHYGPIHQEYGRLHQRFGSPTTALRDPYTSTAGEIHQRDGFSYTSTTVLTPGLRRPGWDAHMVSGNTRRRFRFIRLGLMDRRLGIFSLEAGWPYHKAFINVKSTPRQNVSRNRRWALSPGKR